MRLNRVVKYSGENTADYQRILDVQNAEGWSLVSVAVCGVGSMANGTRLMLFFEDLR